VRKRQGAVTDRGHQGNFSKSVLKVVTDGDEALHMSDLSNLLGDVYGDTSSPDGPPVRHEPAAADRVPEWSEDSRLDRAFADWQPEGRGDFGSAGSAPIDDDLAAALSAALTEQPVAAAPTPAPAPAAPVAPVAAAPAPVAPAPAASWAAAPAPAPAPAPAMSTMVAGAGTMRMWAPGDDDIFPMGRVAKPAKAAKPAKVKGKKG